MTEKRLEELIKQGGWVWILDKKSRFGLQLNDKFFVKGNFLRSELGTKYAKLNDIFETSEQAEWALKTVAERIERFEPPMWDDIKNTYGFRFIYYDDIIEFTVNYSTMLDGVEFNTQKIVIRNLDERELLFVEKATKKNYEKACEIVRDLFGGTK